MFTPAVTATQSSVTYRVTAANKYILLMLEVVIDKTIACSNRRLLSFVANIVKELCFLHSLLHLFWYLLCLSSFGYDKTDLLFPNTMIIRNYCT